MAELATIARPYAEALFQAAKADAPAAAVWLDELAAIAGNEQLRQFADNPKVTAQQVFDLFAGVAKQPLSDMARNFLRTVIDNGRVAALPEIAAQFHALKNAQAGRADATVVSTGNTDTLVIERAPGRLSKTDVTRAREQMRRLKFHPRDALPNATALARADALYTELAGANRADLGRAIALMRAALENQDPTIIEECRAALAALTASLR